MQSACICLDIIRHYLINYTVLTSHNIPSQLQVMTCYMKYAVFYHATQNQLITVLRVTQYKVVCKLIVPNNYKGLWLPQRHNLMLAWIHAIFISWFKMPLTKHIQACVILLNRNVSLLHYLMLVWIHAIFISWFEMPVTKHFQGHVISVNWNMSMFVIIEIFP